jgi:hypothetical protein
MKGPLPLHDWLLSHMLRSQVELRSGLANDELKNNE